MRFDAYHAKLAARDPEAIRMAAVFRAAGVQVLRRTKAPHEILPGETFASGAVKNALSEYGPEITTLALKCIRRSTEKQPGEIRADAIMAVCSILRKFPAWMANGDLMDAFEHVTWADLREAAHRHHHGAGMWKEMAILLVHELAQHLGKGRSHGQTASRVQRH